MLWYEWIIVVFIVAACLFFVFKDTRDGPLI